MSEKNTIICVSYRVDEDGEYFVDVDINDYEPQTLKQLGTLLASIPSTQFQIQTINIVKDAFLAEGKSKELETLIADVIVRSELLVEALEKKAKEGAKESKNEPCIKPSDML